MGIAISQVVSKSTTSGSSAQVIDGSLRFDDGSINFEANSKFFGW